MRNTLRGSRILAAGLIAACTAISASVAIATAADATTAARASTTAHVSTTGHVSTTAHSATAAGPARRGPSPAQLALLEQRAKVAGHVGLKASGAITGSVTGFDGQPVGGACVTAVGAGRSVTTTAAPDGTFRLFGLPAGSYALEYRDCAAPGRDLTSSAGYLTTWSGGAAVQSAAARIKVSAGQVRHVPVVMLQPANPAAAIAAQQAAFQRTLAANSRAVSAAAAAKTGEITGTVTGKGKPLGGICVRVRPVKPGHQYAAKTGKNGIYTVRNIPPGQYHVVFALAFGCPSRANWLQQVYKDDNNINAPYGDSGTAVRVRAGHKVTGINASLRLGGAISGTVSGKSGAKLRGICVSIYGSLGHRQSFGFGTKTTATGSYQMHALFPGKYSLHFNIGCGSGSENYAPVTHPTFKLGLGQRLTVNEVMPIGASISGTVSLTTSSGTPLKGICVNAFSPKQGVEGFTSTNSKGDYRVIGLTGGSYQLDFFPGCNNNGNYTSTSLTAQTTAGQQTSNVNAVLQVGGKISGTITDSHGKPVSGICVEIVTSNMAGFGGGFDNNGSYSIDQLPAGTYQVGFFGGCGNRGSYAPNWYNNQPSENTATSINLTTGEAFPLDIVMQPGATITGRVTNASGNALSGVCVDAATQSDAELSPFFSESQTGIRNGTYTLSNLAPGQYLVNFGCWFGRHYAAQWFPGAPDPGAADLVSASAGLTSGINAVLRPGGRIRGVVTGQGGHPLANVCVAAVNTKGALPALRGLGPIGQIVGAFGFGGGDIISAITNAHGAFDVSGLAAGRYQVSFSKCFSPRGYAQQWYRDKSSASAATDVTVRAGKTTAGIGANLALGGKISGRVVNASGKPLTNICILATNQTTNVVVGATPGRGGTYSVPGLSSGRYTVEFAPCGNQNLITVNAQVTVTAPHAKTGVNATMQPGGSIAGTVTAGSADVSGACVEVYSGSSAEPVGFGFTGFNGSYLVTGLAKGSYQVYFGDPQCLDTTPGLAPQWYNGQASQAAATSVTVKVGATTGSVNAALQPDGQITGTVSGPSATPLSGACVTAFPVTPNGSLPVTAVTGATGYTLAGILPGQYTVRFSAGCGAAGYTTQWWKDAATQKTATIITVTANQTASGISATLSKSS